MPSAKHEDPHFDEDTKACMCEYECCSLAPEICICSDCNGGCGCRHPDLQETETALHVVMDERNDALLRIDKALALCEEEIECGGPGTASLDCFPVRIRAALREGSSRG